MNRLDSVDAGIGDRVRVGVLGRTLVDSQVIPRRKRDGRRDVVDLDGEAVAAAVVVLVADRDGDGVAVRAVGVGVRLRAERDRAGGACRGDLVGRRRAAVAPVDRDIPGAVGAGVGEAAEVEAVAGALVGALVGGGRDDRRDVGDGNDLDCLGGAVGGVIGVGHADLDVGLRRAVGEAAAEAAAACVGLQRVADVDAAGAAVGIGRLVDAEGVDAGV